MVLVQGRVIFRSVLVASVSILAAWVLIRLQGTLSLGDLLAITVSASLLTAMALSLATSPAQFFRAMIERVVYVVWVPVCLALVIAILVFRIGFLLFKIGLKMVIGLFLWLIYFLFPIDLIPDFILGLGQLDDLFLLVTVVVWGASHAMTDDLLKSLSIRRPVTDFP